MRGVAEEVDDDGGDEHLDDPLTGPDGLAGPLAPVRGAAHVEVAMELVHPHKQPASDDDVADQLQDQGAKVEQAEFGELEDVLVLEVGLAVCGQ